MSRQSNVHKEQITLYLTDAVVAELDRQRAATKDRDEVSRNAHAAFVLSRALMARAAPPAKPRPVKVVTRANGLVTKVTGPASFELSGDHEGARLRAAREAAQLTQPQLAVEVTKAGTLGVDRVPGELVVSRQQIARAERAATLDGYPALRAWLQAQETKA